MKQYLVPCLGLILSAAVFGAQAPQTQPAPTPAPAPQNNGARPDMTVTAEHDYKLGTGDQISVTVSGLDDEFSDKVFRLDGTGTVTLPLIGRVHMAGETVSEAERDLAKHLESVLKNPQPVINIQSFGSEPVSVLGAVRSPGIVQLQGRKTLFDTLSLAGGLMPEAGYSVEVTRPLKNGTLPLTNAEVDQSAGVSVAMVRLKDIINKPSASQNIQILPGDTISVPKAGIVYAVGSVSKPGGFPLNDSESMSALQVLALAEGLSRGSAPAKARILRTIPGSTKRQEIPVDLKLMSKGKAPDVQLHPDDILFVPDSSAKKAGLRTIDAIVNAATYASVYAR
jgi:polysaccharide export outer membrane protein